MPIGKAGDIIDEYSTNVDGKPKDSLSSESFVQNVILGKLAPPSRYKTAPLAPPLSFRDSTSYGYVTTGLTVPELAALTVPPVPLMTCVI